MAEVEAAVAQRHDPPAATTIQDGDRTDSPVLVQAERDDVARAHGLQQLPAHGDRRVHEETLEQAVPVPVPREVVEVRPRRGEAEALLGQIPRPHPRVDEAGGGLVVAGHRGDHA